MTTCRQAADIAWCPLYPFGHEYQAILKILFPNGCANLALAAHAGIGHERARAAIFYYFFPHLRLDFVS